MIHEKEFLKALEKTDFNLLQKQKLKLVDILSTNDNLSDDETESLDGILNLLDALMDIYFTGCTL